MVFAFKLTHFIPQTTTSTLFREPIISTLYLTKFGLRPEHFE